MIPLFVLIAVTVIARIVGKWWLTFLDSWPASVRLGLAVMFCFTAAAHFNSMRQDMLNMVPPWVPSPEFMVNLTGICEVLGAIGLLIPGTRKAAAIGLILFLIAVFPANVHAAQVGILIKGRLATPIIPRLLMQLLFMTLTWWAGIRARRR